MTGHFTSYKTRPNHELATLATAALASAMRDRHPVAWLRSRSHLCRRGHLEYGVKPTIEA